MREKLVVLVGSALLSTGCQAEVQGQPMPEKQGELEVVHPTTGSERPGLGRDKKIDFAIGQRVIGVCLVYPSRESATIATGFMKIKKKEDGPEYYVPTLTRLRNGDAGDVFQVSEDRLEELYLRCNDSRRL